MDFNLTEEQTLLRESVSRFLAKEYRFEARRQRVLRGSGIDAVLWNQLAELGLLGIGLPEDFGGMGGSAVDTMLIMEQFGRALVAEPYLPTVILCGGLLAQTGSPAQKEGWLPPIVSGEAMLALAHHEAGGRFEDNLVETQARSTGNGWQLHGAKSVVLGGPHAQALLVSARTSGDPRAASGVSLFLVPADAEGVSQTAYMTQDGGRASELRLNEVTLPPEALVGAEGQALPAIERALDRAGAALCAEAVGIMDALNETTLQYLKDRRQFGQPIGRFQALQHRMVDMTIHATQARSMMILAAVGADDTDPIHRRRAVSAARALIGRAGRFVGQQAVQLHGGMGVTDELVVSHWFKRLTMINATFGDAEHFAARFSDQLLAEG